MKLEAFVAAKEAEQAAQRAEEKERRRRVEAEQARLIREVYQPAVVRLLADLGLDAEEIAGWVSVDVQWLDDTMPAGSCNAHLKAPGYRPVNIAAVYNHPDKIRLVSGGAFSVEDGYDGTRKFFDLADALIYAREAP